MTDDTIDTSGLLTAPAWMDDAACLHADPDQFFPEEGEPVDPAKRMCVTCPVRVDCLIAALERNEQHGVWGGLSPNERRSIRRVRSRPISAARALAATEADLAEFAGHPIDHAPFVDVLRAAGAADDDVAAAEEAAAAADTAHAASAAAIANHDEVLRHRARHGDGPPRCERGHVVDENNRRRNGYYDDGRQRWECATCGRARTRRRYARQAAA